MFFSVEDGERPSITSVFIIVGVLISLLYVMQCIISNTKLERLLFFVTIFAILLPFFFVNNAAYAPRYTIIFLPFCLFPIAFFVNRVKKTYFS